MKHYLGFFIGIIGFLSVVNCSTDDPMTDGPGDLPANEYADINSFVWGGLNFWYLWQGNVPDLADDRFETQAEFDAYISVSPEPEEFFRSLLYDYGNTDFFSWIVDDYVALENSLQGTSDTNGVDFALSRYSSGSEQMFGYVRLIFPDSDASGKNIKRGDLFTEVDGTPLTVNNYRDLLFSDNPTYTLTLAKIEGNTITPTGEVVELTKTDYSENPVFATSIIEEGGKKIGYMHYTQFYGEYESELNTAFLEFKNAGITDLVLDLRYNPGGYGVTALAMAGMITGQFKGEIYGKDEYNNRVQSFWEESDPDYLVEKFTDRTYFSNETINSLNLTKLTVITSDGTASAGESLINGLNPYIDITLIGEVTYGKYTGSITLYDSDNFRKDGANPDHKYAMQPIVVKSVNVVGESAKDGFQPDIFQSEDIANMGVIGDPNEPLLRTAIDDIIGVSAKMEPFKISPYEKVTDYRSEKPFANALIYDKPEIWEALSKGRSNEK